MSMKTRYLFLVIFLLLGGVVIGIKGDWVRTASGFENLTNRVQTNLGRGQQSVDVVFEFLDEQTHPTILFDQSYQLYVADINGDGLDDLIWNSPNTGSQGQNRTYVGLGQPDGQLEFLSASNHPNNGFDETYRMLIGDFNGDGKDDLVWNSVSTGVQNQNRFYIGLGRYDGTLNYIEMQNLPVTGFDDTYTTYVADINGDGTDDLVWNSVTTGAQNQNRTYIAFGRYDGTLTLKDVQNHPNTNFGTTYRTLIADINGDGKDDLVWNDIRTGSQAQNRIYIGVGQSDGSLVFTPVLNHPVTGFNDNYQTLIGDFNGDGNDDLAWNALRTGGGAQNRVYFGLGQPFSMFEFLDAQNHSSRFDETYLTHVGDVNGDGNDDLIWNSLTRQEGPNLIAAGLSQANGELVFPPIQMHPTSGFENYQARIGDINGDGNDDLIWNTIDIEVNGTNRIYIALSNVDFPVYLPIILK